MTGVSDQNTTGHPDNTQARNTLEENTMQRRNTSVLIKRTYSSDDHSDEYLLAGTNDECMARVERMIRNNPKAKVHKSARGLFWHVTPPGGSDGGFFGHRPLDLLIVNVPTSELVEAGE